MPDSNHAGTVPDRSTPSDLIPGPGGEAQRLSSLFAPCFSLILRLRATDDFGDPAPLRRRVKTLLKRIEERALRGDRSPKDLRRAQFAVVAFIDETILASNWDRKQKWIDTPLQLELYDRYDAGEVFFEHLDDFLAAPRRHAEVLEVYYLCMTLGFRGQYRIHEQERRRELIETSAEALARLQDRSSTSLSPHGQPQDGTPDAEGGRVPLWSMVVAALLAAALLYTGLSLGASSTARDVAEALRHLAAR